MSRPESKAIVDQKHPAYLDEIETRRCCLGRDFGVRSQQYLCKWKLADVYLPRRFGIGVPNRRCLAGQLQSADASPVAWLRTYRCCDPTAAHKVLRVS